MSNLHQTSHFGMSHGLKTSKGQYSVIIIAPPFGNRICHALYNSNILCSICTKLHMFDKCAGLNTCTCQYPVIVIAPPAGSRKFGTYKWLWYIPPIFITLNAYCSPFAVFLKPPLAVSPGARSRSSLLAALILYYINYSWGQKFTYPLQNLQNVNYFTKIRVIIQNAFYCLFSTDLNKIFHIKDVYI